ncbi:hypothetical protein HWI79_1863 [Cryptosporidium felis]|nr:hypothetical protein HWI79_1863 [Cryptosporidium felis]
MGVPSDATKTFGKGPAFVQDPPDLKFLDCISLMGEEVTQADQIGVHFSSEELMLIPEHSKRASPSINLTSPS